jgi:ER membrane protein complex subunit 1
VVSASALPPACAVYVLDGAKGTIVYHARLPPAPGSEPCDVNVALAENWFVYHYYDGSNIGAEGSKGYRLVSVELYEGDGVDKKIGRSV